MKKGIKIKIYGSVQGVGFRNFVKLHADKYGLKGYVKNTEDGSLEVAVFGDEEDLVNLKRICKKGPRFARIEKIEIEEVKTDNKFIDFEIRM